MVREKIILDLQTSGNPFMINFGKDGSIFSGSDLDLKTLIVLAIKSRTENLEAAQNWVEDISQALSEYDSMLTE